VPLSAQNGNDIFHASNDQVDPQQQAESQARLDIQRMLKTPFSVDKGFLLGLFLEIDFLGTRKDNYCTAMGQALKEVEDRNQAGRIGMKNNRGLMRFIMPSYYKLKAEQKNLQVMRSAYNEQALRIAQAAPLRSEGQ
jgi:hypothetical protein